MIVYYHPAYNINLGPLNRFHPFDGMKFKKVTDQISRLKGVDIRQVAGPVSEELIDAFADDLFRLLVRKKTYILRALEVPFLSFIPFSLVEKRILEPMRLGVEGTLEGARTALLERSIVWNLSGGYHHASRANAEGFCIFNDVGITVQQLRAERRLSLTDKILIIDIDAHHGNGNAQVFMDEELVTLLDIYNKDIYPVNNYTRQRVNIRLPVSTGISGSFYLQQLKEGLEEITEPYAIAFIIAGTDVLAEDPLGRMRLSLNDCIKRDEMVYERLSALSIPSVFLGGGGYSSQSAVVISKSIENLSSKN